MKTHNNTPSELRVFVPRDYDRSKLYLHLRECDGYVQVELVDADGDHEWALLTISRNGVSFCGGLPSNDSEDAIGMLVDEDDGRALVLRDNDEYGE